MLSKSWSVSLYCSKNQYNTKLYWYPLRDSYHKLGVPLPLTSTGPLLLWELCVAGGGWGSASNLAFIGCHDNGGMWSCGHYRYYRR